MNAAMTPATAPALVTKVTIYRQPGTQVGIFRMTYNSYKATVAEAQNLVNIYKKIWVRHHYKSAQDAGKAYCYAHTQLYTLPRQLLHPVRFCTLQHSHL